MRLANKIAIVTDAGSGLSDRRSHRSLHARLRRA